MESAPISSPLVTLGIALLSNKFRYILPLCVDKATLLRLSCAQNLCRNGARLLRSLTMRVRGPLGAAR